MDPRFSLVKTLFVTAICVGLPACGSTADAPAKPSSNTNIDKVALPTPSVAPPTETPANGSVDSAPANLGAKRGQSVYNPGTSGPKPTPQFRPSGENSETAVTMDNEGHFVEVRVFRDHPQFERIEAVWIGLPLKELRFKLRNGKTITAKTEKLTNLQSATTAQLLEIAGLSAQ